jgi:hypothetical protein
MMLKVWIVVAALAATGLVQAQGTGGKKELVAKVLQLQQPGLEQMARTMAQQPAAMMMQQAAPVIQRLPAERRDALARDIELLALRERIDAVDRELLALLNRARSWRWRSANSRSARARWCSAPSAKRRSSTA